MIHAAGSSKGAFLFFSHEQFGPLRLHCAQPPPQQENIKQSRHSERLLPHWKTQYNHFIPYSLQRKRVRGRENEREVILAQTCCLIMPHAYGKKNLRDQTELVNKSRRHLGFQINLTEVNICYWVSIHLMYCKHYSMKRLTEIKKRAIAPKIFAILCFRCNILSDVPWRSTTLLSTEADYKSESIKCRDYTKETNTVQGSGCHVKVIHSIPDKNKSPTMLSYNKNHT